MPPLPKSDRLIELYHGEGCLVRMVSSAEKEIDALTLNEEDGFMVRPSSFVQNDLPTPPFFEGGCRWGVFIDSSISSVAAYKSLTYSDKIPLFIAEYEKKNPAEQQLEGSLQDYIVKRLNSIEWGQGKTALRNLSIPELKDKLTEMRDRAQHSIMTPIF